MEKYTRDDLLALEDRLSCCLYSYCQIKIFGTAAGIAFQTGTQPTETVRFKTKYYGDKFMIEISELYTFFHNRKDSTITNEFKASEKERLKLRDIRHPIVHVDGDIDKNVKAHNEFFSFSEMTNQVRDLILMINYLRTIMITNKVKPRFLKMVKNMFPREVLEMGMSKDMFE